MTARQARRNLRAALATLDDDEHLKAKCVRCASFTILNAENTCDACVLGPWISLRDRVHG
jgi:hypothetical protein